MCISLMYSVRHTILYILFRCLSFEVIKNVINGVLWSQYTVACAYICVMCVFISTNNEQRCECLAVDEFLCSFFESL